MKDEDGYFYIDEKGHKCRDEDDEIDPDKKEEEKMTDGYYGKCRGCGADGFWEEIEEPDATIMKCECGHEEVNQWD